MICSYVINPMQRLEFDFVICQKQKKSISV